MLLPENAVVAITGRYWNLEAPQLFGATIWLGDRYFLLPLAGDLRTFLFCDMTRPQTNKTK
jgi:hypothetical protein